MAWGMKTMEQRQETRQPGQDYDSDIPSTSIKLPLYQNAQSPKLVVYEGLKWIELAQNWIQQLGHVSTDGFSGLWYGYILFPSSNYRLLN